MSNLKLQTIHHLYGKANYITTTKNQNGDYQIGVGNSTENYTKAMEINANAQVVIPQELQCVGISGYAVYSPESKAQRNATINQYYVNGEELQRMFREIYNELATNQN